MPRIELNGAAIELDEATYAKVKAYAGFFGGDVAAAIGELAEKEREKQWLRRLFQPKPKNRKKQTGSLPSRPSGKNSR